ncbi:MAG TPA: response regulator transcription factor [Solirubrobacterales bacterium]|nr:response regulator transcription factor [Solirubrobacterales bacterium]
MSPLQSTLAAVPATRRTGVADPAGIDPERVPSVAIYHDRALGRAALAALLQENGVEVLAAAPIDVETVLSGPEGVAPDVALIGVSGQGVAMAHRLGREQHSRVLLVLDSPPDGDRLLAVAGSGACGAICHQCPPQRVLRAIHALAGGGMFFECAHHRPEAEPPPPLLSERERHVALELARGAGSEEIAAALCISPHTARTHVRNIKRKLGARTLAQAVALAITMRLVIPPGA